MNRIQQSQKEKLSDGQKAYEKMHSIICHQVNENSDHN